MISHENFADSMQAKRFLVSRIVEEAHRQHDDLSDLEEKMLYFSESFPTLPDMMEIAAKFENEVDAEVYEAKIAQLSKNAYRYDRKEFPEMIRLWKEAIAILKTKDHYLLVMLRIPRPMADIFWLILASFITVLIGLSVVAAMHWVEDNVRGKTRDNAVMLSIALIVVAGSILKFTPIGKKLGDWFGNLAEKVIGWFQ